MKQALALRHVHFEDLGSFEEPLRSLGYEVRYQYAWEPLPRPDAFDLVTVLGGPIGAYEVDAYPFLKEELGFIQQVLEAKVPFLGVCLGAQLLAAACGGRVHAGHVKEIGLGTVTLSQEAIDGGLTFGLRESFTVLHWHGDTFSLPAKATAIASNNNYANQAFAVGPDALGLQFHLETQVVQFEAWLVGHANELASAGRDVSALRRAFSGAQADLRSTARGLIVNWLDGRRAGGGGN